MTNRNIFTDTPTTTDKIIDAIFVIVLGLLLTVGALAYFDILVK